MNVKRKNTVRATAIGEGLISLLMAWFSVLKVLEFGFGNGFNMDAYAWNSHVTLFIKMPVWFIVMLSIAANVLQYMSYSRNFEVSKAVEWGVAGFAALCMSLPFYSSIASSREFTVGLGWMLGMYCAIVPLICLFARPAEAPTPPSDHPDRLSTH
jgi:hypothetical protein